MERHSREIEEMKSHSENQQKEYHELSQAHQKLKAQN